MEKKDMMATWFDSDSFSFDEEPDIQAKANICLMAIDDEVCDDELDDYDIFNNEYEGLLVDFEKLLHKCTKYRKIINTLTLDCNEVSDLNLEYKSELNDARIEIETLRLELENKDKALMSA